MSSRTFYVNPLQVVEMVDKITNSHKGQISELTLDWEIVKLSSPGYEKPREIALPLLLVNFY